jgi:hypothetical protein
LGVAECNNCAKTGKNVSAFRAMISIRSSSGNFSNLALNEAQSFGPNNRSNIKAVNSEASGRFDGGDLEMPAPQNTANCPERKRNSISSNRASGMGVLIYLATKSMSQIGIRR